MNFAYLLIFCSIFLLFSRNIASPSRHPYAKIKKNNDKLYNFYAKQADYYIAKEFRSYKKILPAYPVNTSSQKTIDWTANDILKEKKLINEETLLKAKIIFSQKGKPPKFSNHNYTLYFPEKNTNQGTFMSFNPNTLGYDYLWLDQNKRYNRTITFNLKLKNTFIANKNSADKGEFFGYYHHYDGIIFSYKLNGIEILEMPKYKKNIFTRNLYFYEKSSNLSLNLFSTNKDFKIISFGKNKITVYNNKKIYTCYIIRAKGKFFVEKNKLKVEIITTQKKQSFKILIHKQNKLNETAFISRNIINLKRKIQYNSKLKNYENYTVQAYMEPRNFPYSIDRIPIPKKSMLLSSLDFANDGTAYLSCLKGNIWKVSGLETNQLGGILWEKIATGLNSPFGIKVQNNQIYVLEQNQITQLIDLNNDQLIDFYKRIIVFNENKNIPINSYRLLTNKKKEFFHLTNNKAFISSKKKQTIYCQGLTNSIAITVNKKEQYFIANSKTQLTPIASIKKLEKNKNYKINSQELPYALIPSGIETIPGFLCYIPNQSAWKSYHGQLLGFSYSNASWYYILKDFNNPEQGAIVPVKKKVLSGAICGAFHPIDKQLYVIGVNNKKNDTSNTSFVRVNYLDKRKYEPISYQSFLNGIVVNFDQGLDKDFVENKKNFLVQSWQYKTNDNNPFEYSNKKPSSLGHDILKIKSVSLLENKRQIFIEIKNLKPSMQVFIRMHLKNTNQEEFKQSLFATIKSLHSYLDNKTYIIKPTPVKKLKF